MYSLVAIIVIMITSNILTSYSEKQRRDALSKIQATNTDQTAKTVATFAAAYTGINMRVAKWAINIGGTILILIILYALFQ